MPVEAGRTTARKRILLPGGAEVWIPVVTQINFVDPVDRYQEWQYKVDNSAQSGRTVHVDTVHALTQSGAVDGSQSIQVERIDLWPVTDAVDRGQETQVRFDNVTGANTTPIPHFETHFKTHYKTWHAADEPNSWVMVEYIDEVRVLDPVDRAQETYVVIANNPTGVGETLELSEYADISDTANGVDPPYRTDPFQNIVAFASAGGTHGVDERYAYPPGDAGFTATHGFYVDAGQFGITIPDLLQHLADGDWYIAGTIDFREMTQVTAPDHSNEGFIGFTNNEWTNYFNLMGGPLPGSFPHPYNMEYWHGGVLDAAWLAYNPNPGETTGPRPIFITQWVPSLTEHDGEGHPRE